MAHFIPNWIKTIAKVSPWLLVILAAPFVILAFQFAFYIDYSIRENDEQTLSGLIIEIAVFLSFAAVIFLILMTTLQKWVRSESTLMKFLIMFTLFLSMTGYFELKSSYTKHLVNKYLDQSHNRIGIIYSKRSSRHNSYWEIQTGIDREHTKWQSLDRQAGKSIQVGDTIILRVSDQYPRVHKVLNWHPDRKEIERCKIVLGSGLQRQKKQ